MKSAMNKLVRTALVVVLTVTATTAWGLTRAERKEAKKMLDGTLYLRVDAPCATGRHPYGTYKRPLVEVSPEGSNSEAESGLNASWWHADSTYWGIRINDPVELDELDWERDEAKVEIELEGVGPADDEATVIELVEIHSLEDFKAAFENAFARQPLQDEHDDWSAEVKEAIAERRLENGMTKRQVYYVVGTPESFEKRQEGGVEVEIWQLRQDKGMKMGYFTAKAGESTGLPASVRFEDGKLVNAVQSGKSSEFDLDN